MAVAPSKGLNGAMPSMSQRNESANFVPMNAGHLAFLASDTWAEMLRADLLP